MDELYHIFSQRVIYAYIIDDEAHRGYIKVTDKLLNISKDHIECIKEDPNYLTVGYVTVPEGAKIVKVWWDESFKAQDIYDMMDGKKIPSKAFHEDKDIWFKATVDDVDTCIKEIKEAISNGRRLESPIHLRPEQTKAIDTTVKYLKSGSTRYLWNAKMRFGKTFCALEVAKRMGYKYTLIVTHRPVVNDSWEKDFKKVFDETRFKFGQITDKNKKASNYFKDCVESVESGEKDGLVFFVSIQYLRLSHLFESASKKRKKETTINEEKTAILNFPWDFVVIDEAHEGTQSERGVEVMRYMKLNVPDETSDSAAGAAIDSITQKRMTDGTPSNNEGNADEATEKNEKPVSPREGQPITLSLSGTPFNLYTEFSPSEIYTWDYVREQSAKQSWNKSHFDDPNPYDVLPKMHIFNLDIEDIIDKNGLASEQSAYNSENELTDEQLDDEFSSFSFSKLFEVWDKKLCKKHGKDEELIGGNFVHENEIMEFFYALAIETREGSNFPFSTPEFRDSFRHTLWLIPGVKEGQALKELLEREKWTIKGEQKNNPYFQYFCIINVAGSTDEDLTGKALKDVEDHIYAIENGTYPKDLRELKDKNNLRGENKARYDRLTNVLDPEHPKIYTITLSCGKLTTGVSVPEWTAVFYMKGNDDTSAASYMQTIFRTQTPWAKGSRQKTDCYVFDFSPTRCLKVFADAVRLNLAARNGNDQAEIYTREEQMEEAQKWLEYLPLISNQPKPGDEGVRMEECNASELFARLDSKLIERVVLSGYADNSIYDSVAIMELTDSALDRLTEISGRVSADSKSTQDGGKISVTKKPTKGQIKRAEGAKGKSESELTPEEREARRAVDEYNRQRRERMKTMRAISIRIPLLMYGADIEDNQELEIDNFTTLVDDASWAEFMPSYISKEDFNAVRCCYDSVRFKGAALKIRDLAMETDHGNITERVRKIAKIFSLFHNPDKETVLTPWRVVNMHMADTLGGYRFYDEDFQEPLSDDPVFVYHQGVTEQTLSTEDLSKPVGERTKGFEERNNELDRRQILEINSKTGLYPLYVAYSLYRDRMDVYDQARLTDSSLTLKDDRDIWAETLRDNIFVVCKTPMAAAITRRTLAGFMKHKDTGMPFQVNAVSPEWLLTEKQLKDAGVIKLEKGVSPDPEKRITSDLVALLRVEAYEDEKYEKKIESEKKRASKKGVEPRQIEAPVSRFKQDVTSPDWWREKLPQNDYSKLQTDMIKFDAIIGNPPYQLSNAGEATSSDSIFTLFIDAAISINPLYFSFITPSRWMAKQGRGIKSKWCDKMMECNHFIKIFHHFDEHDCFKNATIKGGINYFLYSPLYNKECQLFTILDGEKILQEKYLNAEGLGIVVLDKRYLSIINKIEEKEGEDYFDTERSFSSIISGMGPFTICDTGWMGPKWDGYDEVYSPSKYKYYYNDKKNNRKFGWVEESQIQRNLENANFHKVFIPGSGGSGTFKDKTILGKPLYGEPRSVCSQTYMIIGVDGYLKSKEECEAVIKYIKTSFFRFLITLIKNTQSASSVVYRFVPLLDFKSTYPIDWSKDVEDINEQLFNYYEIDPDDRTFIKSKIQSMD